MGAVRVGERAGDVLTGQALHSVALVARREAPVALTGSPGCSMNEPYAEITREDLSAMLRAVDDRPTDDAPRLAVDDECGARLQRAGLAYRDMIGPGVIWRLTANGRVFVRACVWCARKRIG